MAGFFTKTAAALALMAAALAGPAQARDNFEQDWTELAKGVWAGVRPVSYNGPVIGNTVIVIGKKGVLLFDPAGYPLQGERVAAKVAELTDLPVTHMAMSHWHGDHSTGLYKILETYPGAEVITHEFTAKAFKAAIMGGATPYDADAVKASLDRVHETLRTGVRSNGETLDPSMRPYLENLLDNIDLIARQSAEIRPAEVTQTFEDSLIIDLGGRKVELRHLGHGNTKGDIIMVLPKEKIVATGDMVVRPTPYGFFSYPRSWAASLEKLKQIGAKTYIPGHGDIMTDASYIDLLIEAMTFVADSVDALAAEGKSLEEVRAAMDWTDLEQKFTGGSPVLNLFFTTWFKTPIVEAAYNVATGKENESLAPPAPAEDEPAQ